MGSLVLNSFNKSSKTLKPKFRHNVVLKQLSQHRNSMYPTSKSLAQSLELILTSIKQQLVFAHNSSQRRSYLLHLLPNFLMNFLILRTSLFGRFMNSNRSLASKLLNPKQVNLSLEKLCYCPNEFEVKNRSFSKLVNWLFIYCP